MFISVEFESQQTVLRGPLYRPEGDVPFPVVVMAHGTSATITMTTDRYAEAFREAGLAVLLYDHRNFGASGGEPRQEINPWVQARGYCDAMTYLQSLPSIDPDAMALWGDSYSAAEVIVVGAVDERPAAVVAQIPAMGPHPPPPDPDGSLFAVLRNTLLQGHDRQRASGDDRSAPRRLRRSDGNTLTAHADSGLPVVHRIRRPPRHRVGEPGDTRSCHRRPARFTPGSPPRTSLSRC